MNPSQGLLSFAKRPPLTLVLPDLFLGSLQDAEQLATENPHRIHTVISLCREFVERRDPKIRYWRNPISDTRPIRISELNHIMSLIHTAISGGPTLIHCYAGLSRSPAILAAYLDEIGLHPYRKAIDFLQELRPDIDPSPVLVESIARELD